MRRAALAVGAVLVCGPVGFAGDDLKAELLAQEKQILEAIKAKDEQTLRHLLADELLAVVDGERTTAAEQRQRVAGLDIRSYDLTDVKAVAASKDVGILSYVYTWEGKAGDREQASRPVYATAVFARRDGRWVSVFYQESPRHRWQRP